MSNFVCTCDLAVRMNSAALSMALEALSLYAPERVEQILRETSSKQHSPLCSKRAVMRITDTTTNTPTYE
jgi:hypothetical protein